MQCFGSGGIVIVVVTLFVAGGIALGIQSPLFATINSMQQGGQQPNINASTIFDTHSMVLGNNIKNLVILVPDEAHESTNQPKNQLPLANQAYLPQNAIVNVGTTVIWFNGDVDHDHKITLDNSATGGFESGDFSYNTASNPITFNDTGTFNYFEADVNSDDPSFVMNGTINVINQVESLSNTNATTPSQASDSVGIYMVPSKDLDQYITALTSKGFSIDSTHTFADLRGGQKGTGPEQTYVVWTTSGMKLAQIISALEEITPTLPYS
jgi:plastocyanin